MGTFVGSTQLIQKSLSHKEAGGGATFTAGSNTFGRRHVYSARIGAPLARLISMCRRNAPEGAEILRPANGQP